MGIHFDVISGVIKMAITTVKLQKETKERLDKLRENRNESYDDILRKILYVLNATREDPFKAKKILERIGELRDRMIESEVQAEAETKEIEAEKLAKKKEKMDREKMKKKEKKENRVRERLVIEKREE